MAMKYAQLSDLIYFDQKATQWNKEHFYMKQDGLNLISDTTLASITSHLADAADTDTTEITTGINNYFATEPPTTKVAGF